MREQFAKNVFEKSLNYDSENFEVVAFSWRYQNLMTQRFVEGDFKFVGLVIVACLFYLIFHTRSIFLGFFSLINICMSVPIALCIYSYIFQIYYFQSIH